MRDRLLRAPEVAKILDVQTAFVYLLAREGRLPGVVRLGRHVRFDPVAIEDFIRRGGQARPGGLREGLFREAGNENVRQNA